MAFDAVCTLVWLVSSAWATPFNIRTKARRTAVTLMGSKVAFRTNTGACITEGRLAGEIWDLVAGASGRTPLRPMVGRGRKPILGRFSICAALASLDNSATYLGCSSHPAGLPRLSLRPVAAGDPRVPSRKRPAPL